MINKEIFEIMVKAIAMLLSVLISAVIIPYVKNRLGEGKLERLKEYAEIAVRCAEQIYTPEEWKLKKIYASEYVSSKVAELGIEMTIADIDALIEATVNLIKYGTEYSK